MDTIKLDLSYKAPQSREVVSNGDRRNVMVEAPVYTSVLNALERSSRTITEARQISPLIEKIKSGKGVCDATKEEFDLVYKIVRNYPTTQKVRFAEMVEEKNSGFDFAKYEGVKASE